jgi:hypothetical protein
MLKTILQFLEQPGINVSGLMAEAGIKVHAWYQVKAGNVKLSQEKINKLMPVLKKYGFKQSSND